MIKGIVKRLLIILITMLIVSMFVFIMQSLSRGDSASFLLSEEASKEELDLYSKKHGLDQGIIPRYLDFLISFFTFDWGKTISGLEIKSVVSTRFPVTLSLSFFSLLFALFIAIPWTLFSVRNRGGFIDKAHGVFATMTIIFPSFLTALIFSLFFGLYLKWFPVAGYVSFFHNPSMFFRTLFLPSLTLALLHASLFMRVFKASLFDNLDRPYSIALRAQGGTRWELILYSALKPSLPIMVSLVAESLASSLAGAAVVESVFALPGVGSLMVNAALSRDMNLSGILIMIIALIVSSLYFLSYLISALLDPRIRRQR